MRILSIETSCDETSAAVVERIDEQSVRVLSNITATSLAIHATTGGIIPENAAREQVKYIIPVISEALQLSVSDKLKTDNRSANQILKDDIDAISVTYGPGLIGSLLVGVETAKTLSFVFNKPIIPVNHLLAHLFANFIQTDQSVVSGQLSIVFPFIGLIVSGGHTDLLLFKTLNDYKWLGGTRDDAAGEAIDKIGRLLNLPYPAGPDMERRSLLANKHKPKSSSPKFQSPMINSDNLDFSFSGLKAEVSRFVKGKNLTNELTNEISRGVQDAIFNVLIKKTLSAAEKYKCSTILLGGGVSANQTLLKEFKLQATSHLPHAQIFAPEKQYSTDNAAMIGAYAALNYKPIDWNKITAEPDLYFA